MASSNGPEHAQGDESSFTGAEAFDYADMEAQPKASEVTAIKALSPQEAAIHVMGAEAAAAVRERNPNATEAQIDAARQGKMSTARRAMEMHGSNVDGQIDQHYASQYGEKAAQVAERLEDPDLNDKERAEWTGHLESHRQNQAAAQERVDRRAAQS